VSGLCSGPLDSDAAQNGITEVEYCFYCKRLTFLTRLGRMENIEPRVFRQRLVIEGHFKASLTSHRIKQYLTSLSELAGMTIFAGPYCWPPDERSHPEVPLVDLNGFIAWKESGCHVYAFSATKLFTSDIYTCKPFDSQRIVDFTRDFVESDDLVFFAY
jgi:S-adenosylmethionine decarboxylase